MSKSKRDDDTLDIPRRTGVIGFLIDWTRSRTVGSFQAAVVVSLLAIGTTVGLTLAVSTASTGIWQTYRTDAAAALKAGDLATAELCLDRLMHLGAGVPEMQFQLALAKEERGETEQAERILKRLAPAREAGYVPAQLRLVRSALANLNPNRQLPPDLLPALETRLNAVVSKDPKDADARLLLAQVCRLKRDHDGAAKHLAVAAVKYPERRLELAGIYARQGNLEDSRSQITTVIESSRAALRRDPEDHDARLLLARALSLSGQWREAETLLKPRLQGTRNKEYRAALAEMYSLLVDRLVDISVNNLSKATEILREAYRVDPQSGETLRRVALLCSMEVTLPEAMLRDAEAYLADLEKKQGKTLESSLIRGRVLLALGEAAETVKQLEGHFQESLAARLLSARAHRLQGNEAEATRVAEGICTEAAKKLSQAPDPSLTLVWADAAAFLGRFEPAEEQLLTQLGVADSKSIRWTLANLYLRWAKSVLDADPSTGIERLCKGLSVFPGFPPIVTSLLEMAPRSHPHHELVRNKMRDVLVAGTASSDAHKVLGSMEGEEENWKSAVFHFEQALKLGGEDALILNNLAWCLAHQGPAEVYERALAHADRALELTPGHPDYHETRGFVQLRSGHWNEAVTDLETALRFFPDRKYIHTWLATAYSGLGQPEIADRHRALGEKGATGE